MAAAGFAAGPAAGQARFSQGHGALFGGRGGAEIAPPVAKYVAPDDRAFILDRSSQTPLLKFEGSQEVWVLRPAPGPRGDVIYRDDLGRQMVRASRMGGMTVFTADRPSGLPAALAGQAVSIRPSAVSPVALIGHFVRQAVRAARAVGRRIPFEAPEVTPETSTLFADAATTTAEAMVRYSGRRQSRLLARLRRVRFTVGPQPAVSVTGNVLNIIVAPSQGLAGRPSSERIVRTMAAAD
ncbi:MAG: DUF4908 domain-containing protein [Proteobacteria bacterium]|nr:DUF4908 domain-containing protein [Pseudomonadota bacterium]